LAITCIAWLISNRAATLGYAQSGIDSNIDPTLDPLATISDVPHVSDLDLGIQEAMRQAAREQWNRDNQDWFEDHGFTAWSEAQAPFEHYGDGLVTFRYTPADYYSISRNTFYEMGNQPPYTLQMGPVSFNFHGGVVRMAEGENATGQSCDGLFNYIHAYSGWANQVIDFPGADPTNGDVTYQHAWLKGYLTRHVVEVNTAPFDSCNPAQRSADYV